MTKHKLVNPLEPLLELVKYQGRLSHRPDKDFVKAQQRFLSEASAIKVKDCVLYVAPTGKAASVMRKRTNKKAYTIHQILASYKAYRNNPNNEHGWKFSAVEILAVDESSMVSVELFAHLVKNLLEESKLKRVVFLGDNSQFPSNDPGKFMTELYYGLIQHGCVSEL